MFKNLKNWCEEQTREKKWKGWIWKFAIALIIFAFIVDGVNNAVNKVEEVSYTTFMEEVDAGEVDTVYYYPTAELMRYTLFNADTKDMSLKERAEYNYPKTAWKETTYPDYETFRKDLLEKDVRVVIKQFSPAFTQLISTIVPLSFMILLIFILMVSMGPLMQKSEEVGNVKSDVKFADVIGHEEIIGDLKFITELIKGVKQGKTFGADIPKGVLLSGPPGTGKTLLGKAIAGESGVLFIYMNASSFIEMYVGLGAKRVRTLFKSARKVAPCVVFIDEIDSVGKSRSRYGNNSEDIAN